MILFSNLPNIIMYGKKLILKRWRNLDFGNASRMVTKKNSSLYSVSERTTSVLAVHESNHYGISIKCIIDYLNAKFKQYSEECNDNYLYTLIHEIMPGDDFLTSLKKAKTTSFITLTVSKDDLNDDFMRFANRTDINDEVQILIKNRERPRNSRKI